MPASIMARMEEIKPCFMSRRQTVRETNLDYVTCQIWNYGQVS